MGAILLSATAPVTILSEVTALSAILVDVTALSAIFVDVIALFEIVVATSPAVLVISPVKAGNLAAASKPVTFVPDKFTAPAVMV